MKIQGIFLTGLVFVAACDDIRNAQFDAERADSTYRTAMADYQAGRLPQALAGLKKTCAENPANASARFQLACLLQDSEKDYTGAFCAYREYVLLRPDSEKAKLAKDRLQVCEREMATAFVRKYASKAEQEALSDAQAARAAKSSLENECAKLKESLAAVTRALEDMRQENARLKGLMKDEVADEKTDSPGADIAEAKKLLDEKDGASGLDADIAEAKRLAKGDADEKASAGEDDIADAKKMLDEDKKEPPPLLAQAADAKDKRAAAREAEKRKKANQATLYPHEKRPDTYVVQEGDTLYKIAVRFYGRASAWNRIRNANRAIISTDGRVRKGQKLTLPAGD